MSAALIEVRGLTKSYTNGDMNVPVLLGITLGIQAGEFVAIMGPPGSGKSTFMNIIGCLDRPSGGAYYLDGEEVARLSTTDWPRFATRRCWPAPICSPHQRPS